MVTPSEGRVAVKRSLLGATQTWRLFTLCVEVKDSGIPPLSTSAILNIVVDASLPFASAHKRLVVINNNRTIVLVLSCLSSATLVLLVTVAMLLCRFASDRKQDGGRGQTGSGNRGRGMESRGGSRSGLLRTALARYRDGRRRRAKQKQSLAGAPRDFTRSEELSWLSAPASELNEREIAWGLGRACCRRDDMVPARDDNTSAVVIVNDTVDHSSASSTLVRV